MTTRPTSHLIHNGLLDIVSLIPPSQARQPLQQSQLQGQGDKRRSKPENDLRAILNQDALKSPRRADKGDKKGKERNRDGKRESMEVGLRKRKVDKGMIGSPTNFR